LKPGSQFLEQKTFLNHDCNKFTSPDLLIQVIRSLCPSQVMNSHMIIEIICWERLVLFSTTIRFMMTQIKEKEWWYHGWFHPLDEKMNDNENSLKKLVHIWIILFGSQSKYRIQTRGSKSKNHWSQFGISKTFRKRVVFTKEPATN
jgi:hypothetical protein